MHVTRRGEMRLAATVGHHDRIAFRRQGKEAGPDHSIPA